MGTSSPRVRRRMAGYTELYRENESGPGADNVEAVVASRSQEDVLMPPRAGAEQDAPAVRAGNPESRPAETAAAPDQAIRVSAPVRKRRMGGAPAPKEHQMPAAQLRSEDTAAGSQPQDLPSHDGTRDAAAAGTGSRRRMSAGAPQATAATTDAGVEATPAPLRKTRMGSAPAQSSGGTRMASASGTTRRLGSAAGAESSGSHPGDGEQAAPATVQHRQRMSSSPSPSPQAVQPPATAATPGEKKNTEAAQSNPAAAKWLKPAAITAGLVLLAVIVVFAARWLRSLESVQQFIETYNGHASQPDDTPVGTPGWMGWQHFFNMFFMVLIVRTGLQVRSERKPPAYWTAKRDSFFSPRGNTPKKVSLTQWLHQGLDVLWMVNGALFVILLFSTGHWKKIVPTSWDIFPNMLSAGLQYASLNWPTENGWVHYNALQVAAYFITVFIAAPLAVISGVRFSTWWPEKFERLSKAYPVEWARAVHVPVMLYFVAFTLVHVFLVFFTGALRNLNHMYSSRDATDWWGLLIFLGSLVIVAAGWFLTKPLFTTPVATKMGTVTR